MAVLSIQSQVARGTVGNSVSAFVLERLGHEVWQVPTAILSNHPGLGPAGGGSFPTDQLDAILKQLGDNGWYPKINAVQTGYIGHADQIPVIADAIDAIRDASPDVTILCDPVCGDAGSGLYVDQDIVESLIEYLIPRADIVMPNVFELGALTGEKVVTIKEATEVARYLPAPVSIVTSVMDEARYPGQIETLLVKESEAHLVAAPKLDFDPKGAGDLLSALFLSGLLKRRPIEQALAGACGSVHDVLASTAQAGSDDLLFVAQQDRLQSPFTTFTISRA